MLRKLHSLFFFDITFTITMNYRNKTPETSTRSCKETTHTVEKKKERALFFCSSVMLKPFTLSSQLRFAQKRHGSGRDELRAEGERETIETIE